MFYYDLFYLPTPFTYLLLLGVGLAFEVGYASHSFMERSVVLKL